MAPKLLVLVSLILTCEHFSVVASIDAIDHAVVNVGDVCDCKEVDIVSNRDVVLRKHSDVLGRYNKVEGVQGGVTTPSYVHSSGKYFLYYSTQSQVQTTSLNAPFHGECSMPFH